MKTIHLETYKPRYLKQSIKHLLAATKAEALLSLFIISLLLACGSSSRPSLEDKQTTPDLNEQNETTLEENQSKAQETDSASLKIESETRINKYTWPPEGGAEVDFPLPNTFARYVFADTFERRPLNNEEVVSLKLMQEWIWPHESVDLGKFLREEIIVNMTGDRKIFPHMYPGEYYEDYATEKLSEYDSFLAENLEMFEENERVSPRFSEVNSKKLDLLWFNERFATLLLEIYSYSGGAHGMSYKYLQTYDLIEERILQLEDMLIEDYEAPLIEILEQTFREEYGIADEDPLSVALFENEMHLTDNFGLTAEGFYFIYQPYEIAAGLGGSLFFYLLIPYRDMTPVIDLKYTDEVKHELL